MVTRRVAPVEDYATLNPFFGSDYRYSQEQFPYEDLTGQELRAAPTIQPIGPTPEQLAAAEAARQQEAQAAAQAAATEAAQKQAALDLFNSQKNTSRDQAYSGIASYLTGRGLNASDFDSSVNSILDQQFAAANAPGDALPKVDGLGIGRGVLGEIKQDTLDDRRSLYQAQASKAFGPNYGDNLIDDNLVNPVIEDILGRQSGDARNFLDRGRKRGIYNDVGIAGANRVIDDGLAVGRAKLSGIGRDVIKGYEAQGDEVGAKAAGAASGYTLGGNFNVDEYTAKGSKIASDASANAGNEVRNKFGGTQLFDFGGITNAAGAAQGATGLVDGDVYAALANRKKSQGTPRGLGNQGTF